MLLLPCYTLAKHYKVFSTASKIILARHSIIWFPLTLLTDPFLHAFIIHCKQKNLCVIPSTLYTSFYIYGRILKNGQIISTTWSDLTQFLPTPGSMAPQTFWTAPASMSPKALEPDSQDFWQVYEFLKVFKQILFCSSY